MTPGTVIRSLAGRDKGRLHVVLAVDKEYVLIADGKWRKIQQPKRKKIKHIRPEGDSHIDAANVTNKELRRIIAEIEEGEPCQKKM